MQGAYLCCEELVNAVGHSDAPTVPEAHGLPLNASFAADALEIVVNPDQRVR